MIGQTLRNKDKTDTAGSLSVWRSLQEVDRIVTQIYTNVEVIRWWFMVALIVSNKRLYHLCVHHSDEVVVTTQA